MLINISNHPLSEWTENQIQQAKQAYGGIIDVPFPQVSADCDENEIIRIARETFELCEKKAAAAPGQAVFHVMGEMTLNYALVRLFQQNGYECIASVTERKYKLNGAGYVFLGFRKYPAL